MEVTADSGQFKDAITRVVQALDTRPALPVLAGILLDAEQGALHIWAAGSGQAGYANVRTRGAAPGRVLVDGQLLARIARHLPGETITLTAERSELHITSGPATWTLLLMPEEEYPGWPASVMEQHGNHAEQVKPQRPDHWETQLTRGERLQRPRPWKVKKARKLYESQAFGPGDWVQVATATETLVGQMACDDIVIWIRQGRNEVQRVNLVGKGEHKTLLVTRDEKDWPLQRADRPTAERENVPVTPPIRRAKSRKCLGIPKGATVMEPPPWREYQTHR